MVEFAVTPWTLGTGNGISARTIADQASLAESMGFHSFWLPENHFADALAIPSPLTLLAAAAAVTTTLKLATTSYLITIRNPLQAAEEVAVLDQLCEGRLILGLGRGMQASMFQAFDLPTKDKRKRFQENLDIMLSAWRGEAVHGHEGIHLTPLPVQQPHPELWMAAFGPLALKQAGRLGMPYLASPMETLQTLKQNYQHFNGVVEESGLPPVKVVPVMRSIFVTENQSLADNLKQTLAATAPHQSREPGAAIDDWAIIGDATFVRDKLEEYIDHLGVTLFIARGRFPLVSNSDQVRSHEALLSIDL
jgi:alkanesulfonate monooxygenase SsuD/methylene tetrahydromethanopterin reductase-like flavin-dependent oxidoreductase (luciferase family)